MGPRDRVLSVEEETIEVLEVIEDCENAYEIDDINNEYIEEY